jgi:hypothetical protein
MRFLMMVKGDRDYEAGRPTDPRLMAAIGQLTAEMMQAGVVLASEGLRPSSRGALIRVARGGRLSVSDGPFAEAKEVVGGFAILRARSKAEAVELGSRFMRLHAEVLGPGWEGECEVRELAEFSADPATSG